MIRHHRKIDNPPPIIDKSVQSSPYTNNLVDLGNIPNFEVNFNVINKVTAKWSKPSRRPSVPNQHQGLRVDSTTGMMQIVHPTKNGSTRQARLDIVLMKPNVAESIN
jgi:hypothetical protein